MVSQCPYQELLPIALNIHLILNSILLNIILNIILISKLHPILCTTHLFILLLKLGITLPTNTNLLFSRSLISLPTILPSDHHQCNLATNTLSLSSLSITILPTTLPTHHPINTPTHLLVKLHSSNLIINSITKCLFSLCINLLTKVLYPIIHLSRWVNIPTDDTLGTTNLTPFKLSSCLLFKLTKYLPCLFTKPLSMPLFSFSLSIRINHLHPDIPLILIAHLQSMPYFLDVITHNIMCLVLSGLNSMQEITST